MSETKKGRILSCLGGIYTVYEGGREYICYAKGKFRHDGLNPICGDYVTFSVSEGSDKSERISGNSLRKEDGYILEVEERKNELPRPQISNIDTLFIVCAVTNPTPDPLAIDKLTIIADNRSIEPILIFNKAELDPKKAEELEKLYSSCGFTVLTMSAMSDADIQKRLYPFLKGKTSAFAGPSGVGKTTIMNALFPSLNLTTGRISQKTLRGRHTTRECILYNLGEVDGECFDYQTYLADTPGFSLLDFEKFGYLDKKELAQSFREFEPMIGTCRYTKCTHLCEEGCRIVEAVADGSIPKSRHENYVYLYNALAKINKYKH